MYFDKIASIFFNITAFSRLMFNLTVISFVFFVGFFLDDIEENKIFTALAIIQMTASFMSFGFGANILKPLIETPIKKRNSIVLHAIIVKIGFVVLATIIIKFLGGLEYMSPFIVFVALLGSVWAFTDIYVESMSSSLYKRYFVLKAIVALFILGFKVVLIKTNIELLYCVLTLEGFFPLIFLLVTHLNVNTYKEGISLKYFGKVYGLIKHGAFIWISSFLQIGGSRLLYLIINTLVPIKFSSFYYIFLRLIEGLMFIPNNICASFFKKIINKKDDIIAQQVLRYKMLKTCLLSSFVTAPILFVVLFLYLKVKGLNIDNYILLLPIVICTTIFSFLRIWISREIVINENLIASPISYTFSFLVTAGSIFFLSDQGMWIVIGLLVYYFMSSVIPFTVYGSRMTTTLRLLKKLCHVQIKS